MWIGTLTNFNGVSKKLTSAIAISVMLDCSFSAFANDRCTNCLRAVVEGKQAIPVKPCAEADPLALSALPEVKRALTLLDIDPAIVKFRGCEKLDFAVVAAPITAAHKYVITYPSTEQRNLLAPVLHELSHVLQLEAVGGFENLFKIESKKIELGADYLTGIMFAKLFPNAELRMFEQNILLTGLYVERDEGAHGTPSQRTQAFRLGAFGGLNQKSSDMKLIHINFLKNIYGTIL